MKIFRNIMLVAMLVLLASCSGDASEDTGSCTPLATILVIPPKTCNEAGRCWSTRLEITDVDGSKIGLTSWMVKIMRDIMQTASQNIFQRISTDTSFRQMVHTAMTLALMFYAAAFMFGIASTKGYDVFLFLLRLILVWNFATNMALFNSVVVDVFEGFVNSMVFELNNLFNPNVMVMVGGVSTVATTGEQIVNNMFDIVDSTMSMWMSPDFAKLLLATMTTGLAGWFYAVLLVFVAIWYMLAIFSAVKVFIMALIARFLLYSVAPLFIVFAVFDQTRSLFRGWVDQLMNFSFQPVFLFAFLAMYHVMIEGFIASIVPLDKTPQVCYGPFIQMKGGAITLLNFWRLKQGNTEIGGPDAEIPLDLWVIISLVIMMMLMKGMAEWTVGVASRLSGGLVTAGADIPIAGAQALKQVALSVPRLAISPVAGAFGIGTKSDGNKTGSKGREGIKDGYAKFVQQSRKKVMGSVISDIKKS